MTGADKRRVHTGTHIKESRVKTEAEIGVIQMQTKEQQESARTPRSWKRPGRIFP